MCGILGAVGYNIASITRRRFERSLELISHRGPDSRGSWSDEEYVHLGHTRLAILDTTSSADQPYHYDNLTLTYNGEIYNYRYLRRLLESKSYKFSTGSDTEVLVKAWHKWGAGCLNMIEGMFAFGVWDKKKKLLTIARDKYGEKPLFYHENNGKLIFASELPPLVRLSGGQIQPDINNLGTYLQLSYFPIPGTSLKGVKQLRPGNYITYDVDTGAKETSYYDLEKVYLPSARKIYSEECERLRYLLLDSVKKRISTSDVPVACFLSGGVDSSVITALASSVADSTLPVYSLSFPDEPEFNESEYAQILAAGLPNLRHKVIEVGAKELLSYSEQLLSMAGEPMGQASIIPTAYLCTHVKEKVALGGDGADEVFGGYGIYSSILAFQELPKRLYSVLKYYQRSGNSVIIKNATMRAFWLSIDHLCATPADSYMSWRSYVSDSLLTQLNLQAFDSDILLRGKIKKHKLGLRDLQELDFLVNLPGDMLRKLDYASMVNNLEIRSPYLDSKVVNWAINLPEKYLIKNGVRKKILRDAFKSSIPREILKRGKKGFLMPIRTWMRESDMQKRMIDLVDSQDLFDKKIVYALLQEHQDQTLDHSVVLWSIYAYLMWATQIRRWAV